MNKSKTLLRIFSIVAIVNCLLPTASCFSQGAWVQKANFGGAGRWQAVGFSIGNKGYIGAGSSFQQDFWEWDKSTDTWTQKANFGGTGRNQAVGFAIGTKGYIGTGDDGTPPYNQDFWEYNAITNVWTQKANFGGTGRIAAVGFSIGTKGYIGTGQDGTGKKNDFWEYDPSNDTWVQKANFSGQARTLAVGFSIGTKGYLGTGTDGVGTHFQDFYEYDQSNNSWVQKANFTGIGRAYAVGFSIGNKGYIGGGAGTSISFFKDFWEWNQTSNTWNQETNFSISGRQNAVGFSIGNRGYIGTGYDSISNLTNDFREFSPSCTMTINITTTNSTCGQATGTASVVATAGTAPYTYQWTNGDKTNMADSLSAGLYMVTVTDASGCTEQAPAMINDAGAPVIVVNNVTHVLCNGGNNGAISMSVAGGTAPYTYFWANGNTNQNMSNLQAGPHQVQVIDAAGCKATKIVFVNGPTELALQDSIKNASCGSSDGAGWVFASGGTQPYSYQWSTGATTSSLSNISAGSYSVMVTDNNGCKKSGMGTIVNLGAATAVVDSVIPAACASGVGSVYITVSGGSAPYTYAWTNGATTQDLVGVPAGNYGVTIYSNGNPCTGAFSGVLPAKVPYAPVICIVTVDSATGKNQCVFVKDSIANLSVKQYNFYRETTTAGVYQKLGSKQGNLPSLWTDQSANPLQRAWRYKITAEDSCGTEAPISVMHKTIHMAANIGINNTVNLIWDDYEGFSYSTFIIYRYTSATGWDSLDAVPSNLHSYTDLTPPSPLVNVFYYVAVKNAGGCIVSSKNPNPMANNLNFSKSNVNKINPTPTGVQSFSDPGSSVTVYPNPTTGQCKVQSSKPGEWSVDVLDVLGRKILSASMQQTTLNLNLGGELNGIYFIQIRNEEGTVTKKIVVQK